MLNTTSNIKQEPFIPSIMVMSASFLMMIIAGGFIAISAFAQTNAESNSINRNLLIVVDGLRPDYIRADMMPNLHALGERGVFGEMHSAVYPTMTRVNSASISTGSFPARHGIIHNIMWLPEMGDDAFSTGNADYLKQLDEITGGELITTISVGEVMDEAGRLFFVCGSGGAGNTWLQNHRGKGKGIWNAGGLFVPESAREEALKAIGERPNNRSAATVWAFDAYLYHALGDTPPDFTLMWIGEPDGAGHRFGVGSPEVLQAIANVDGQIGRIMEAHDKHELSVNIFVTSDHGFTTNTGEFNISRILSNAKLIDDRVKVVSNMIFLMDDNPALLGKMVEQLQRHEEVGAVYTRPLKPGSTLGRAPGTISTAMIQWDHERSADIIAAPAWNDDINEYGFAGATSLSETAAIAAHGTDSPYDVQIRLVAAGPDIKTGVRSNVPTSNIDLIPTILHLQGIEPPLVMEGRVLHELLEHGMDPKNLLVHEHTHIVSTSFSDGFRYKMGIETLYVDSNIYFRSSWTKRFLE